MCDFICTVKIHHLRLKNKLVVMGTIVSRLTFNVPSSIGQEVYFENLCFLFLIFDVY